jgi:CheY-like chemotaxis protein
VPHSHPYVLVVDDDDSFRAIAGDLLRHAGYEVHCLSSARAALTLIARRPPALIFLDLRMPKMSGWQFLEVKRRHPRLVRIPVVIVSAFIEDEPILEEGVCMAVGKPVDVDRLLKIVAAFCPTPSIEEGYEALPPNTRPTTRVGRS